jgi:TolB-like protein/DNA-binding winged helix-turn-helix (wHTH) protein/Flp pilus assembly protein TadD
MDGNFRVGAWLVEPSLNAVSRDDRTVHLEPKVMAVMVCLAENQGELVSKEKLLQSVWPDTFVTDDVLKRSISELRRVFEDDARDPRVIQTIAKRGYRLITPVVREGESGTSAGARVYPAVKAGSKARLLFLATSSGIALLAAVYFFSLPDYRLWRGLKPLRVMLAVLPFENLTGDPKREFFGDGLTEEMITQLGSLNHDQLGVIARTSVMSYKIHPKAVSEIGHELGVEYLLEGSFREEGDHVRITAQLIRTRDQTHLWAAEYDRSMTQILLIQGEVARNIAREISVRLSPEAESKIAAARSVSAEGYEAYLEGQYYWNRRTPEALKQSLEYYKRAIEKDPEYASAFAGLARTYFSMGTYSVVASSEAFSEARVAANKAVALDPALPDAHGVLAVITDYSDWDWPVAEQEYKHALDLNSNYATAHHWFSMFLARMGRFDEAIVEMRQAHELDPLSMIIDTDIGGILLYRGAIQEDIEQQRKTLEIDPNFAPAHSSLALAYERAGRYHDAIHELQIALQITPTNLGYKAELGRSFGLAGKKSQAEEILSELEVISRTQYVSPYSVATVYFGLGDKDRGFEWLERAHREHDFWMAFMKVDPRTVPLHSDSRFQELLRRMKLPPN